MEILIMWLPGRPPGRPMARSLCHFLPLSNRAGMNCVWLYQTQIHNSQRSSSPLHAVSRLGCSSLSVLPAKELDLAQSSQSRCTNKSYLLGQAVARLSGEVRFKIGRAHV